MYIDLDNNDLAAIRCMIVMTTRKFIKEQSGPNEIKRSILLIKHLLRMVYRLFDGEEQLKQALKNAIESLEKLYQLTSKEK